MADVAEIPHYRYCGYDSIGVPELAPKVAEHCGVSRSTRLPQWKQTVFRLWQKLSGCAKNKSQLAAHTCSCINASKCVQMNNKELRSSLNSHDYWLKTNEKHGFFSPNDAVRTMNQGMGFTRLKVMLAVPAGAKAQIELLLKELEL